MYTYHRAGDIVSRRKGIVMHRGIVQEDGSIYHNTPLRGEHSSSEDEFRKNKRIQVQRLDPCSRAAVLRATQKTASRRYNPFTNNCEHTVSRAVSGQARSPQLTSLLVSGGVAGVTLALTRSWPLAVASFAFTRKLTHRRDFRTRS